MSSDSELERRLREARGTLAEPDAQSSRRAHSIAVMAARRRRPRRLRAAALIGTAFAVALGMGVALGTVIAPRGVAAEGPVGLGFLPATGWYVLQTGGRVPSDQPALAIAASTPFQEDDASRGIRNSSGLPYSTLLQLPPRGVVMIATFARRLPSFYVDPSYPERDLPLRFRDAAPYIQFGVQVRPEKPLGQYQLRATVNGHLVDVQFYFGSPHPSPAMFRAAQEQLDRLVVGVPHAQSEAAASRPTRSSGTATPGVGAASRVVDRTLTCTTAHGSVSVVASPQGTPDVVGSRFNSSGYGRVTIGSDSDPLGDLLVIARPGFRNGGTRFPGAVYASARRCVASRSIPLSRAGLPNPPVRFRSGALCRVGAKVSLRVHAVLKAPAGWGRLEGPVGSAYVGARGRIVEAEFVIRDPLTRTSLAYVKLGRDGQTQFWSGQRCI